MNNSRKTHRFIQRSKSSCASMPRNKDTSDIENRKKVSIRHERNNFGYNQCEEKKVRIAKLKEDFALGNSQGKCMRGRRHIGSMSHFSNSDLNACLPPDLTIITGSVELMRYDLSRRRRPANEENYVS